MKYFKNNNKNKMNSIKKQKRPDATKYKKINYTSSILYTHKNLYNAMSIISQSNWKKKWEFS